MDDEHNIRPMNREIVTDPLEAEDLWSDLRINIEMLNTMGVTKVLLLFGFAWGNAIYQGAWTDIPATPEEVEKRIAQAETEGHGKLGSDNLYITIPKLNARLQYSYETDIHLSYSQSNAFVNAILKRWSSQQWHLEGKIQR